MSASQTVTPNARRHAGSSVLITGGASGIGLSVARQFKSEGANVAVFDRSAKALAGVAASDGFLTIEGDVRSLGDNRRAVDVVVGAFGKLDTFIGNAGIFDQYMTLDGLSDETAATAFDELMGINVKGYLLGAKAAVAALRASGGTMVFTASVSGVHPAYGGILYIPAKHAVVGLTRRLALELAPLVRVNAVAPGYVPTALAGTAALGQGTKNPGAAPSSETFLMQRVPEVIDYAPLYTFLAARDAITLTGQVLVADNGATLQRT